MKLFLRKSYSVVIKNTLRTFFYRANRLFDNQGLISFLLAIGFNFLKLNLAVTSGLRN